jgi:transposase
MPSRRWEKIPSGACSGRRPERSNATLLYDGGVQILFKQYRFENFYMYGAVEPTTGESFFLELPQLNTVNFQIFLDEFAHHYQASLNIVLMDNGSCHKAKSLVIPDHVVCLFLPPYSPELNTIERLWQDLKARLAWILVAQLEALERHVETLIRQYSQAAIQSLTSYPYFVHAVNALLS